MLQYGCRFHCSWKMHAWPKKKAKKRISVLSCLNKNSFETFFLILIRNTWKSLGFQKKKTGMEHGLDYQANKKVCMTCLFFMVGYSDLTKYSQKTSDRKVALLIEKCSAQGLTDSLSSLRFVTVIFLLPSTTSEIQPINAAVIATVQLCSRASK